MTRRVRVVRLRRRPVLRWWAVAAAVFTLAWVLELWLFVLGSAAGTIVLVRSRRWHRRTVLPAVVAGTAAARPPGATPAIAVEQWAAICLAVISGGRPDRLRHAARLAAASEADPWTAHVAITRLEAAETALIEGQILGLSPPRGRVAPGWPVAFSGIAAAILLALAQAGGRWWLLPITVALTGAALSLTDLEASRVVPRILATEALAGPAGWDDGEASPLQLALLAGGDDHVIRRARRLVETAHWEIPHREAALRQLRAAEAMSQAGRRPFLLPDEGLPWWKAP